MRGPNIAACVLAALLSSSGAHAMEVTLCANDTQAPSGGKFVNLQTALQAGGFITFNCGGPATIHLKNTYFIDRDTDISGDASVTLDGEHHWFGMFLGRSNSVNFT